jgi:hypothetical protein
MHHSRNLNVDNVCVLPRSVPFIKTSTKLSKLVIRLINVYVCYSVQFFTEVMAYFPPMKYMSLALHYLTNPTYSDGFTP